MKVVIQGQGEISLTQKEYVASGGEGSIYVRGDSAFKIYADPGRMIPVGKIQELSSIQDPNVIRPLRVLLDAKTAKQIGYTMRFVSDAIPLVQIFTRAYREREGLDHARMLGFVRDLQTHVQNIHHAGVLVVDLNEMNFLVDTRSGTRSGQGVIYAIDVDSYQTKSYPATAIMPSVRDWTVQGHGFTELSDWFSFACVAFQMFTGIHPYKGKHPSVSGLEERMKASISVFDPAVSIPKVVYPVDVIPSAYRDWFKAVLQDRKRLPPPAAPGAVAAVAAPRGIQSTATLEIQEVLTFGTQILQFGERGQCTVACTPDSIYANGRKVYVALPIGAIGFTPKLNHPVVAWLGLGTLSLFDVAHQRPVQLGLHADQLMSFDGRIYAKSADRIVEVVLTDTGGVVIASPRVVTNVLEHASKLYEGVVIQNLLGSIFASVFPAAGTAHQIRIPELDSYKVVDARFDNRVLMVIGAKGGTYDRLTFIFDAGYTTYTARCTPDITPTGLNFVVLDTGVCVHIDEEEKLQVFSVNSDKTRTVTSPELGNDLRLVKLYGKVGFIRGGSVFSMGMK